MRFGTSLLVAALAIAVQAGVAEARQGAPIEYARKAVRPVEQVRAQGVSRTRQAVAPSSQSARTAAPLELPEMLYGYGRAAPRGERPALDLRGRLSAGTSASLMDDAAFDEAPAAPVLAEAATEIGAGEAPSSVIAPSAEAGEPDSPPVGGPLARDPEPTAGAYFIQVGAFSNPANAERARTALGDVGLVTVDVRSGASATLHRVRLGQWATREEAELARDRIAERGFAGAMIANAP
jgi:cell division septation protein DedD